MVVKRERGKREKMIPKVVILQADTTAAFLLRQHKQHIIRLTKGINKLEQEIVDLFSEGLKRQNGFLISTKVQLVQAKVLHAQMIKIIENDYGVPYKAVVKDFDRTAKRIGTHINRAYNKTTKFVGADVVLIDQLKSVARAHFKAYGQYAADEIAQAMYNVVATNGKFSTLTKKIKAALTGQTDIAGRPLEIHAKTIAFDAQRNMSHNLLLKKSKDINISDNFLYYGSLMKTSRQFCKDRAGKVFTRAEIDGWNKLSWQGKRGDFWQFRAGFNCRHVLIPVKKEWL